MLRSLIFSVAIVSQVQLFSAVNTVVGASPYPVSTASYTNSPGTNTVSYDEQGRVVSTQSATGLGIMGKIRKWALGESPEELVRASDAKALKRSADLDKKVSNLNERYNDLNKEFELLRSKIATIKRVPFKYVGVTRKKTPLTEEEIDLKINKVVEAFSDDIQSLIDSVSKKLALVESQNEVLATFPGERFSQKSVANRRMIDVIKRKISDIERFFGWAQIDDYKKSAALKTDNSGAVMGIPVY